MGAQFLSSSRSMPVTTWWETMGRTGGKVEELAKAAILANSKVPASAGAERNWSLFGGMKYVLVTSLYIAVGCGHPR